jgi:hypothetical protein
MNFISGAKYVLLLYSCFMLQKCKEHGRTLLLVGSCLSYFSLGI